jgi:hypothetical protein
VNLTRSRFARFAQAGVFHVVGFGADGKIT